MSALGTELSFNNRVGEEKVLIHAEPISGLHLSDYYFEIDFYIYSNRIVTVKKTDEIVIKLDDDNYKVCITSEMARKLGKGAVKFNLVAEIPDADFPDGVKNSIAKDVCTGVTL